MQNYQRRKIFLFSQNFYLKKKGYNISSSLDGNWNGIVIQVVMTYMVMW